MSIAKLKVNHSNGSAFGVGVCAYDVNPELDGAMTRITLQCMTESVQIRCSHDWALKFAEEIIKRVDYMKKACIEENITPL